MRSGFLSAAALAAALLAAGCGGPPAARTAPSDGAEPRVASLAPNLTEIVCAVGGQGLLVGRTSACNYPPSVTNVPVVGGFGVPSLEPLLAVRPTLVLDMDLEDAGAGRKMERLGLRRERIPCRTLNDIPVAMERVGALLHQETKARAEADALRRRLHERRAASAALGRKPSVYVEVWHDPLTTAGGDTFLSELVAIAGGRNVAEDVRKEFLTVSAEWVLARDPEIILCLYMSPRGSARDRVASRADWARIRAVRAGRIYDGFDNDRLLRPGPRVLDGVEALARCFAGEEGPPAARTP